jgi:ribosomal protein L2
MSVMMYFDMTSAAFRLDGPGQPGARAVRITSYRKTQNGILAVVVDIAHQPERIASVCRCESQCGRDRGVAHGNPVGR